MTAICSSNATWKLQDHFGIGTDYFDQTGRALYTLETHLRYVGEVRAPASLSIETAVLGVDAKRLHVGHIMWSGTHKCATFECMLLHYDTRASAAVVFPETIRRNLRDATLTPTPEWVYQAIRRLA